MESDYYQPNAPGAIPDDPPQQAAAAPASAPAAKPIIKAGGVTFLQHRNQVAQQVIQPSSVNTGAQYIIKQPSGAQQLHIAYGKDDKLPPVTKHGRRKKIKERIFKCGDCDKSFVREEHLKRHTFTHTGLGKQTCEVPGCNKTYSTKHLLTAHVKKIHLGIQPERAFLCIDCGKAFVQRSHLQVHRKNVHGTGPMAIAAASAVGIRYQPIQQAAANTVQAPKHPISYKSEGRGAGKERKFPCTICGKAFIRKDHVQRHLKKVHHVGEPGGVVPPGGGDGIGHAMDDDDDEDDEEDDMDDSVSHGGGGSQHGDDSNSMVDNGMGGMHSMHQQQQQQHHPQQHHMGAPQHPHHPY